MEELQARHRKELKDLQSRITQKKKQANKKTRKGVNDECDRLEAELKERHAAETAALNGEATGHDDEEIPSEQLEELTLKVDDDETPVGNGVQKDTSEAVGTAHTPPGEAGTQQRKPNRQKARLARRAAEQEEAARQAAEDAQNLPDLKTQERERMLDAMKERGLHEKEIRADGHCLYSAVADQLDQLDIPLGSTPSPLPYRLVRRAAADYIEQHQDDFAPFLEEPLGDYVRKIRETGEWGGQMELTALAKTYGRDICVLQDFGRVVRIEGGGEGEMWLGYYKHGFGLGEHYNSLRREGG
ncbi:OTU domain-containing protein 6B [Teratosphaeria destructans]|uniref:OTU domain-containing protein 6B n=1 Tax=Teratosphaeria destructans TaxID=418781 RepID=A0A9W7W4D9_9PEZI|nr:OTU domain-containing protein 6B [Teratosphaeria destructans]